MRNHNYLDLLLEVTCSACDQTYFFSFTLFDWLIIKKVLKVWKFPQNANSKLYIYIYILYIHICQYWTFYIGLKRTTFGQSIWDKVRSYWEHIGEHIESSKNMLRMQWELGENTLGTKKSNTPHAPPKRKNWFYLVYVVIYHWLIQNTVIPFQVWHLGSELLFYISKSTLTI
jgi:hypothetical protein